MTYNHRYLCLRCGTKAYTIRGLELHDCEPTPSPAAPRWVKTMQNLVDEPPSELQALYARASLDPPCGKCGWDKCRCDAPAAPRCERCGGTGMAQIECPDHKPGCLVYHGGPCPACATREGINPHGHGMRGPCPECKGVGLVYRPACATQVRKDGSNK